jgi:asparagine synthase (glutamine-hydrolysing)
MCRIAGIINPSLPLVAIQQQVSEMCRLLKHGGPDDEGFYSCENQHLVLGHRRLALIDLSPAGHQPMSYADERYWISYNGELYNYPELKEELATAGYRFNTHSDTEVILAAFAAWGTNCFRRFNGMFALALWDNLDKTIYLARDSAGIKPLYFSLVNNHLVFASEIRGFSVIPELQVSNPNWPVYLLAYGHVPEPVTTLKNVRPVPKGSFMRLNTVTGKWDIEVFGFFNYSEQISKREDAIELVRQQLPQAVKRHLLSDAPIGVFLSGGLDSGIMALLAARYQASSLKTLSIDFAEQQYSEKKYQDLLIDQLQCANWQEVLTEEIFQQNLPAIINDMDMPGCDGINTWFISKYARECGLKAVLSGIGGDEIFGGYPSFRRISKVNWIEKIPSAILRMGRHSKSKKIRRLAFLSLGGAKGYYLFLRGQFTPASIASQLDADENEVWRILEEQPEINNISHLSPGNMASWIEMNLYMQNQLLRDSDVMSMAHGIEIRVPFLDKEFMQFGMQIRSDVKYAGTYPKQLLIDSFIKELPASVWNRPKMGFSFPFADWLTRGNYTGDIMASAGKKGLENYETFKAGGMHWSQFMSLLLLNAKAVASD